jgi:hypothetical protein
MNRTWRASRAVFAAAFTAGILAVGLPLASEARAGECLPTDHIDNSTWAETAKKMEAAGYMNPHDPTKGCDNYWYARATKNGATVDVVLPPDGEPFTANNS